VTRSRARPAARLQRRAHPHTARDPADAIEAEQRGHPKLVAALADEFFHRGVANYIGTAWNRPSVPACAFAERSYGGLFGGSTVGESVRRAREALHDQSTQRCVWGACQHHGDPVRTLPRSQ
jgi:hypothetical protein